MEKQRTPLFQRFCYRLNDLRLYRVSAALRWCAWKLAGHQIITETYDEPSHVGGYRGWLETKRAGVLAFIKDNGELQFKW